MAEAEKKDSVVEIAKERYQRARDAFKDSRDLSIQDTRFAMGDSDNGWQWPEGIRQSRIADQKVVLTVNLTAQHCNQIINNMRQNRPQCRVLPVDNKADKKTAEILGGLIRNIQTSSNADDAHDVAAEHCIYGGEGYWRVITEYESETSFNQCIKIKVINNPLMVYIDPDARELDKSDAEWGFVFEDISKTQCERDHPDIEPASWIEDIKGGWVGTDNVRRAEYFYCEYTADTALLMQDESTHLKSDFSKEEYATLKGQGIIVDERPTQKRRWKWCKLVGGHEEPLDTKDWAGSYLPIISVIGKEVNVDGDIVRKGIVRDLKDPARMVNFSYSESIQTVALQNKIPYIAPAEAIEGYENEWQSANTTNASYLPYNSRDDAGNLIEKPERQQPAVMPAAQVQMLQLSTEQMRAASGQQNANFGIKSEASSGVGIQRLKAQGEIATFHFPDNQVRGLRYEARVLIDLIPKIYDTKRVIRILGLDGRDEKVVLDPDMDQSYDEDYSEEDIQKLFNPGLGNYDVVIDTGPSYQTQRQEAATLMGDIAKQDPEFMKVAGDLFFRAVDVPMSDQIAKRYEKMLPPQLQEKKGQKPLPPEVQQQMQQDKEMIQHLDKIIEEQSAKVESKEIDQYKAETDRMKVEGELALKAQAQMVTPEELNARFDGIEQMMLDIMRNAGHLGDVEKPDEPEAMPEQPQPPQESPPINPQEGM